MKLNWDFNPFTFLRMINEVDLEKFPMLLTDTHKMLRQSLEWSFLKPGSASYLIVGEKGAGKTTTITWLKHLADKQETKQPTIHSVFINRIKGIDTPTIIKTLGYQSMEELADKSSRGDFPYMFIDIPDESSHYDYRHFVEFLEDFMRRAPHVAMFIAVNTETKEMIENKFSLILGKFNPINLSPFTDDQCRNLIESRLSSASIKKKVFSDEAIHLINKASHGIPRNILIAADMLINRYNSENEQVIDSEFCTNNLGIDYTRAVINDRISDPYIREQVRYIYDTIISEFDGVVSNQKALESVLSGSMARMTLIKHLKIMHNLGLITIKRGGYNRLEKRIEVTSI